MLSNSLYIQIYINLRYEQALDCSIPDTMFSAEYSYLSNDIYQKTLVYLDFWYSTEEAVGLKEKK